MLVAELFHHAGLATSRSHARRLIADKAIRVNDRLIEDPQAEIFHIDGVTLLMENGRTRNTRWGLDAG